MERRGFTLMEILVVIAIIGLLSAVVLSSLSGARDSARKKTAMAQLQAIRTGILLLEADTGNWPNGCPPGNVTATNEYAISSAQAGLASAPSVSASPDGDCEWTPSEVASWRGPYITAPVDPWGTSYYFDPDYTTDGNSRGNCLYGGSIKKTVVHSAGPNKSAVNAYDCDDIVLMLFEGKFVP